MVIRRPLGKKNTSVTKTTKTAPLAVVKNEVKDIQTADDYYYGYKVLERTTLKLAEIVRVYNVRSLTNETAIDNELLESIKTVGVKNPIVVNEKNEILDGHRRFFHAKQVFEPHHDILVIRIKIENKDIAYFQYLTGLEKGHTRDERDTAILKYAKDNPDASDREIAKKFGMGNATVSDLTKILRKAPSLVPYVLNRQIGKASATDLVVEATRYKQEPEKIAKGMINELIREDKLNTDSDFTAQKPVTRAVTNKILTKLIPKYQADAKKSQSTPTAKKLLKDLHAHLKPVGDINKEGRQEYIAHISPDLMLQIELLLNGSIAERFKHKFHKEFKLDEQTEYIESFDKYALWAYYTGLTLSSSITICLQTDDNFFFADENSEFFQDMLKEKFQHDRHFDDGCDWLILEKTIISKEQIIEIAKENDLHLLFIKLVLVSPDDDDVTELEVKESNILKETDVAPKTKTKKDKSETPIEPLQAESEGQLVINDENEDDYTSLLEDFNAVEIDDISDIDEIDEDELEELTEDDI